MKKYYLFAFALSTLVLGALSPVFAEDATRELDSSVNTRVVKPETRERPATLDLKARFEEQKATLEAQREKMKAEFKARKKEAEAKGDEIKAKREMMKLELETRREGMDAKRETVRVEAEAKRAEMRAKRIEFQQDIAKRKVEHVTRVILATIERLERIIIRVESRIAKVKARGGNTSESESYIALAKTNLSDAKAVVATFASIDLSSDKAKDNFERIRTVASEAREHIRAAHQNLMLAVRSLGSVEVEIETDNSVEEQ